MPTGAKYSPLQHGGLEAVERSDGMEVVPGSGSPFPLNRKSTLLNPEPVASQDESREEHGNYLDASEKQAYGESASDSTQTTYSDAGKAAFFNSDQGVAGDQAFQPNAQRDGRRYCGMRKAVFIAVLVVVILLVVVGAVLGGVLGVLLSKKNPSENVVDGTAGGEANNSTGAPLQAFAQTGLASAVSADGSGRLLTYYQAPDGRIVENSYLKGQWTLNDQTLLASSVVTSDADAGSPLAAVSYRRDDKTYRQIFFITATGRVMTTSSTSTSRDVATSWSRPEQIIDDLASAGSPALGACTGAGLDGIHVYYPSNNGYINEVRYHFSNDSWTDGGWLDQSDYLSGVACNVYNDPPDYQIVNVYFRNATTKLLQQSYTWFNDTAFNDDDGPRARNQSMAAGSDIAVCSDDTSTEYIFFQSPGGMIVKSSLGPDSQTFDSFTSLKGGANGTKLAASFLDADHSKTGAALSFQPSSNETTVWLSQFSRSDATLLDEVVT